jgi:hypothetical protein
VERHRIEKWWPQMSIKAKEWLRENQGSIDIPEPIQTEIGAVGGPPGSAALVEDDWDFIRTQSEFVD